MEVRIHQIYGTKNSRMDLKNVQKTAFKKFEGVWSAAGRPYLFKNFKGCIPQILLGPFLCTLTHL